MSYIRWSHADWYVYGGEWEGEPAFIMHHVSGKDVIVPEDAFNILVAAMHTEELVDRIHEGEDALKAWMEKPEHFKWKRAHLAFRQMLIRGRKLGHDADWSKDPEYIAAFERYNHAHHDHEPDEPCNDPDWNEVNDG